MHVKGKKPNSSYIFLSHERTKKHYIFAHLGNREVKQSSLVWRQLLSLRANAGNVSRLVPTKSSTLHHLPITLYMTNTVSYQQRFKTQHKRNQIINSVEKYNTSSGLFQGWTTTLVSGAKSHVCTYLVKSTVATLLTDCQHADNALC